MIAIIPIVILMPAVIVLIPPAVMFAPAAFARLVQFAQLMLRLAAVATVALDGFVEFVFGVLDAPLASFLTLSMCAWHGSE